MTLKKKKIKTLNFVERVNVQRSSRFDSRTATISAGVLQYAQYTKDSGSLRSRLTPCKRAAAARAAQRRVECNTLESYRTFSGQMEFSKNEKRRNIQNIGART